MNSNECAIVQRLIIDLDDTRRLYAKLGQLLVRPHLKFLVASMIESHTEIADDMAWEMDQIDGVHARRGGGVLAGVRASVENWMAVTNANEELACLKGIARREGPITQRLREDMDVRGLHRHLYPKLNQLERTLFRLESMMREMETPRLAMAQRPVPATLGNREQVQAMHDGRSS